jgi:hypothetical protein
MKPETTVEPSWSSALGQREANECSSRLSLLTKLERPDRTKVRQILRSNLFAGPAHVLPDNGKLVPLLPTSFLHYYLVQHHTHLATISSVPIISHNCYKTRLDLSSPLLSSFAFHLAYQLVPSSHRGTILLSSTFRPHLIPKFDRKSTHSQVSRWTIKTAPDVKLTLERANQFSCCLRSTFKFNLMSVVVFRFARTDKQVRMPRTFD